MIDEKATDRLPLAVIGPERLHRIVRHLRQRLHQRACIGRRLGHAHAAMRPGDKGGIAEQGNAAEGELRRVQIVDRLEKG